MASSWARGGRKPADASATSGSGSGSSSSGSGISSMFGSRPWQIGLAAAGIAAVGTTAAILVWRYNSDKAKKKKKKSIKDTSAAASSSTSASPSPAKSAATPSSPAKSTAKKTTSAAAKRPTTPIKSKKEQPSLIDDEEEGEEVNATDEEDHDADDHEEGEGDEEEGDEETTTETDEEKKIPVMASGSLQVAVLDPALLTSTDVRTVLRQLNVAMAKKKVLDFNEMRPFMRVLAAYTAWLLPMVDNSMMAFPHAPGAKPTMVGMCTDEKALQALSSVSSKITPRAVAGWSMFQAKCIGNGGSRAAAGENDENRMGGLMFNPAFEGETVTFERRFFPFLNSVGHAVALEQYVYRNKILSKIPLPAVIESDVWVLGMPNKRGAAIILAPPQLKGAQVFQCWTSRDLVPMDACKKAGSAPFKLSFDSVISNCAANKCGIWWNAPMYGPGDRIVSCSEPAREDFAHAAWEIQKLLPKIQRHWSAERVLQIYDLINGDEDDA